MEVQADVSIAKPVAKSRSFVHGAAVLGICGFVSKLLGAVFRIPLTNIIGAQGMGLYQMVFPLYTLLLTISSSGLPSAISRLIAEKLAKGDTKRARSIFTAALISLIVLGLLASLAVLALYRVIAGLQGNLDAALSYVGIAPSLLFVAVISAFRGYFQGRQNMTPSAVSQLVEQGVKMSAGLLLAYYLLPLGLEYAVLGAVAGVSISEFVAMVILIVQYFAGRDRLKMRLERRELSPQLKMIYAISIPITLGGIILPLTQLIDSVLVINILRRSYTVSTATSLYGLMSGPVNSLINMPVVLSLSIAVAIIPSLSANRVSGDTQSINRKIALALKLTMLIALPCFIGLVMLAPSVINLLYSGGLNSAEIDEPRIAAGLLMLSAISVVLIAFIQVITSVLQALNKQMLPVRNLAIGAAVKIILNIILLNTMGIYGAAVSTVACYSVALVLNILSLKKVTGVRTGVSRFFVRPLLASGVMGGIAYFTNSLLKGMVNPKIAVLAAIVLGAVVYFALVMVLDVFDTEELKSVPLLKRLGRGAK